MTPFLLAMALSQAQIAKAPAGAIITLPPGDHGNLFVSKRLKPLTIRGGTFRSVRIDRSAGIILDGVTVRDETVTKSYAPLINVTASDGVTLRNLDVAGPFNAGTGIAIRYSTNFAVLDSRVTRLLRGIVATGSSKGRIAGNRIHRMSGDGINVADSHNVDVTRNEIFDFYPLKLPDGSTFHPDAIQLWSVRGHVPQSDIRITFNRIDCNCQGIAQFDHSQGGSDRVVIASNDVTAGYPHGISLYEARSAVVADNRIRTLPGSKYYANLRIFGGSVRKDRNDIEPRRR